MIRKIASQSFLYFAATLLNRGLSIVLLPILTRYLSPSDYGILSVTSSVAFFLGLIASLSLENAVQLFYFQLEPAQYRRFLTALWLFLSVAPLVLIGFISVIGSSFGSILLPPVPWHPYLQIAVWSTYFGVLPSILLALLRAKQWALLHTLFTVSSASVTAALTIYFVVFRNQHVLGSLRGQVFGAAITSIVASIALLRYCNFLPRPEFDWTQLRIAIRLSLPYIPYTLSRWVLDISDRWILPRFVSLDDVGIYSLAYSVGMLMVAVGSSLASAFTPHYYQKIKDPTFRDQLPRLAGIYAFVPTWVSLSFSLMGYELLRIATRPAFYGAARLIPLIAFAYWIHIAIYQLQILVLEYHRRTRWLIWLTTPAAALNVGLNLTLIPLFPKYGTFVAASSTIAGFALMAVLGRWFARRVDPIPFPWTTIIANGLIAVFVCLAGIHWLTLDNLYVAIVAKGCVLILAGVVMMFICGLRFRQLWNFRSPS